MGFWDIIKGEKEKLEQVPETVQTEGGDLLIDTNPEKPIYDAIEKITDDGEYITFSDYWENVKADLIEVDHVNLSLYMCALVKLGIVQKIGNAYVPPNGTFTRMRGSDGEVEVGIYRKKQNAKGQTFGFAVSQMEKINKTIKPKIVKLLQEVETRLDLAKEEAEAVGEVLKERWRKDPNKTGKPRVYHKVKAVFEEEKRSIIQELLGC